MEVGSGVGAALVLVCLFIFFGLVVFERKEEAERLRLKEQAEQLRLAEEAEQSRLAEEADKRRLAAETDQRPLAEHCQPAEEPEKPLSEQHRLEQEVDRCLAEQHRLEKEVEKLLAEQRRLAEEAEKLLAEQRRLAEEAEKLLAEQRRLVEEVEQHPVAQALKEAESVYGPDSSQVADCLEKYADLLKGKGIRATDACNMIARAIAIRSKSVATAHQQPAVNAEERDNVVRIRMKTA
jgi:hypothetical protein